MCDRNPHPSKTGLGGAPTRTHTILGWADRLWADGHRKAYRVSSCLAPLTTASDARHSVRFAARDTVSLRHAPATRRRPVRQRLIAEPVRRQ